MRTVLLIIAIGLGILLPAGHRYVWLIRYLLMAMLLLAFADLDFRQARITRQHFMLLGANLVLPLAVFLGLEPIHPPVAAAAFFTALAPTAVGAPVVVRLLAGNVSFAVFSLLLTNGVVALLVPFLLPRFTGGETTATAGTAILPILSVLLIPLAMAGLIRWRAPRVRTVLSRYHAVSFYLLAAGVYLATARASHFVAHEAEVPTDILLAIAAVSLVLCSVNFLLGTAIGGRALAREAGQSLGHKNSTFMIWISLTFINPLTALGPVCYLIFQNIFISLRLFRGR